jgi:hypothetical protein
MVILIDVLQRELADYLTIDELVYQSHFKYYYPDLEPLLKKEKYFLSLTRRVEDENYINLARNEGTNHGSFVKIYCMYMGKVTYGAEDFIPQSQFYNLDHVKVSRLVDNANNYLKLAQDQDNFYLIKYFEKIIKDNS